MPRNVFLPSTCWEPSTNLVQLNENSLEDKVLPKDNTSALPNTVDTSPLPSLADDADHWMENQLLVPLLSHETTPETRDLPALITPEIKIRSVAVLPTEKLVRDTTTQFGPYALSTSTYSYENIITDYFPTIKRFTDKGTQTTNLDLCRSVCIFKS